MRYFCLAISFCSVLACSQSSLRPDRDSEKLRPYSTKVLANGLRIYFFPDTSLPSISMTLLVRSGSASDPVGREGLSYLTSQLLDKGTRRRSAEVLASDIAQMGASFSASASGEDSIFSISAISSVRQELLNTFAEIVLEPVFKTNDMERQRAIQLDQIEGVKDSPQAFAAFIFSTWLYRGHVYERPVIGYRQSVQSIRKKNVNEFYLKNYRPNNSFLAVAGDYDSSFVDQLTSKFESWKPREVKMDVPKSFQTSAGVDINLVYNPSLEQSTVILGHETISAKDSNYLGLQVANSILGGGFASRLNTEVREKRGLTYSVGSTFYAGRYGGLFSVSTFCAHDKVEATIRQVMTELELFRDKGPTREELRMAQSYLLGQFPRTYLTTERFAGVILGLDHLDVGADYLKTYRTNVKKMRVEEIQSLMKQYLHPERLKILVYSKDPSLEAQLKQFGAVKSISFKEIKL